MEAGTLGCRDWSRRAGLGTPTSLQDSLQPQGCHVSLLSTAHPPTPRPLETSWFWGSGACMERRKPLPAQELLGKARKSRPKRGSEMSHPHPLHRRQAVCLFGGGCGYVGTRFKGPGILCSPLKSSSLEFVEQKFQGAANTFSKDKRQENARSPELLFRRGPHIFSW